MEHLREFKEEMEIEEEEESPQVHSSVFSDPSPQTRDVSTPGGGKVRQTWGAISVSLGSMRPLLAKLDKLLLDTPEGCTSKKVMDGMHLLNKDVKEISSCLEKLSQLEDPPPTTKCWMNEARDLSYRMEDYIDSLIIVNPTDPSVVSDDIKTTKSVCKWHNHVKAPKEQKQIAATVSEFRKCACKAIQRRKIYVLSDFKIESTFSHRVVSVSHMLPMPYEQTAVIVIDDRMNEFINSLANDGDEQLKVVSVLGPACLGKTTLARVLLNRIGMQFDYRAFIRVSKKPDMKRIFQDMLSQLQQQDPPENRDEVGLIDNIEKYLRNKRYLIIIDDVWAASVWDIINHALPKGSHGSRIITTTQIEDVALKCCHYQSECVFKMKPLDYHHSRRLFFNGLFGSESDCPEELKEVSNKIVEICDGLPLATISMANLLASQPVMSVDLLTYIHKSLRSCFSANPASERTRQALNLSFNNLPHHLKTCLMYLIMYPEGYTFFKDNLVKQLVAEGFIDTTKGQDVEKVAENYLHQLIGRRFIQPIHINFNNEVLSCTIHDVVHDLIAHKSVEENFILAIDYNCRNNVALHHKARRLSLLFDNARYAKIPANIIKSQVRSLTFYGLFESMPSTTEFKHVRVLNLQLSSYGGSKGLRGNDGPVDLSAISELSRLRYLRIVSPLFIKLPDYMGGLHCLETLDIMDAAVIKLGISVYLPYLLHLCLSLRDERNVQNWIDGMSDHDKLKHLQDLRLTFSSARSILQKDNMLILRDFISGHDHLKTIVVACDSSDKVISSASDATISWDDMAPPALLQRFEFSPHSGMTFYQIPKWVGKLGNLCILKISVRILEMDCVDILRGLHTLTALSLYVGRETSKRIIFQKADGFSVLRYFKLKFTTGISWIKFEENAMPNLLKVKLVFNAIPQIDQYEHGIINIDHMPTLKDISVKFGAPNQEYALRNFVRNHLRNPTINMPSVDYSSYGDKSTKLKKQQDEIMEKEPDECCLQQPDEIMEKVSDESCKQKPDVIMDEELDESCKQQRDEIPRDEPDKLYKEQPDKIVEEERDGSYEQQPNRIVQEERDGSYEQQPDKIMEEERDGSYKQQADMIVEEEPDESYKQQQVKIVKEKLHKTLERPAVKRISRPPESSSRMHVPASDVSQSIQLDVNWEISSRHLREWEGWHEFTLYELMSATSNFSQENLLGGGLYGTIYKGTIDGKLLVAITKFTYGSRLPELEYLVTTCHPHMVRFLGYCSQERHKTLVYEYMPRGNLKHHLGETNLVVSLPWLTRLKIAVGAAKGLSFLQESGKRRFYSPFSASSILLDLDYTAKLWGFGLAKRYDVRMSKSDLYDFGVVLLELLAGRPCVDEKQLGSEKRNLVVFSKDKLHHIMDPSLEGKYSFSAAWSTAKVARRCLSMHEDLLSMRDVVDALEPLLSDDRNDGHLLASGGFPAVKTRSNKSKLSQFFIRSKAKAAKGVAGGAVEGREESKQAEQEVEEPTTGPSRIEPFFLAGCASVYKKYASHFYSAQRS